MAAYSWLTSPISARTIFESLTTGERLGVMNSDPDALRYAFGPNGDAYPEATVTAVKVLCKKYHRSRLKPRRKRSFATRKKGQG